MKHFMLAAMSFGILTVGFGTPATAQKAEPLSGARQTAVDSVESNRKTILEVNRAIWNFAEVGLKENKSAKLLVSKLKDAGFSVKTGGMLTAENAVP